MASDSPSAEAASPISPRPEIPSTHVEGNTVYLLTGASSGIGAAFLSHLLSRPKHTVIALHRPSSAFPPDMHPPLSTHVHSSSALIAHVYTASMSAADVHWLASTLRDTHSIPRIDVVIACAAVAETMRSVLDTKWADVLGHFDINLGGPLKLVQGLRGLLGLEEERPHVFPPPVADGRREMGYKGSTVVVLSSSVSSMGSPEPKEAPGFAYGASKSAANYLSVRLHVEHSASHNLCSFALHPGWVKTRMGRQAAREWGVSEDYPPLTPEESAELCLNVIENATIERHGGRFWRWDGEAMEW